MITMMAILTLLGGGEGMPATQQCEPPAGTAAEAAVYALNQQYIDAARTHDVAWFERHMVEGAVVVLGNGVRLTRGAFLQAIRNEPTNYRSLSVENVTVRAFGATVQVDADAPWELGDGRSGVSRYIDTYAWVDCRWQVVSAQITWLPGATKPAESLVLEIRSYNLKPGTRAAFHRIVVEEAAPMLERWNVDLVAHGPSAHDDASYFVMRAYQSLDERQRSHDAFYGSSEWLEGPRDRILALIETFTTIVLPLPSAVIDELRASSQRRH